ncbi:MAG: hypothetical protein H6709_00510 [Kofleriaceae bacterium]|nr:hypothetical protein [Kofleriaceae bacterium]
MAAAIPTPRCLTPSCASWPPRPRLLDLVARLRRRGHPLAAALATPLAHAPVDLYAAEHAMARAFARRPRRRPLPGRWRSTSPRSSTSRTPAPR